MSAPVDAVGKRHEVNLQTMEGAILDLEGDAILLGLVIEDIDRQRVTYALPPPTKGQVHLVLTDEQVRSIHHARNRVDQSVLAAVREFYGPEGAQ